ncbi:MAG TPA: maleylpyruvate isomerase family mycothiol-dependent enzyme, partial [Streptosporangiaceae bacterium]
RDGGNAMTPAQAQDAEITASIAAERRELAAILGGLPPESWDSPTLCAGWRVREVVAHITMPFRYRPPRFALEMIRSRGNFNRMADRCARRDAAAPPAQLAAALRDNERNPWKPPGGGYHGALTHDVIHGLDITVALGLGRQVPADRLEIVLAGITAAKSVRFFGTDLDGIELRADDLDWSFGSGTPVSGSAQDLALVVCGRKLPPGHLRGEPCARFTGDIRP